MIKTRFAPSPTGFLHIGSLRTALFAYLFAKKQGGKFMLRIEDTDKDRFVDGSIENILHSLYWAGIIPDEGVILDKNGKIFKKGNSNSYIQSERIEIYHKHINILLDSGDAYYCFCDRERLGSIRQEQQKNNLPTGYDGHCRNMSDNEISKRLEKKVEHVIRLKMPKTGTSSFNDLVRSNVEFQNALVDDQILIKSDGYPTYHFAVVVDDHEMEITHVIRGEEWISSTPKHLVLYKMLGWEAPTYAHLSLLINEQKQKLSKRHGDVSVNDFKDHGYLPEALVNFIAFLGWNPGDNREIFSLNELENEFNFEKVGKGPSVFNREKLDWYNKEYIRKMDISLLTKNVIPYFINNSILSTEDFGKDNTMKELENVISLEKERAVTLEDFPKNLAFIYAQSLDYEPELLIWKKSNVEETKNLLKSIYNFLNEQEDWDKSNLEAKIMDWIQKNKYDIGSILWPVRVALSGKKNSPGPFEILSVLRKEKSLQRIKNALGHL